MKIRYNIEVLLGIRMNNFESPNIDSKVVGNQGRLTDDLTPTPPRKRRGLKWTLGIIAAVILILGGYVGVKAANLSGKIFVGQKTDFFHRITSLIGSQTGGSKLIGEKNGQINLLLLGIGGPGHDGPYLSDTIIVAQIRPGDKKATLTSIPRDYLVNTKSLGQTKINGVFADSYAKSKDWDKAGADTRAVVEKITGLEIPYFAVVDFQGFEKTIDLLGGVDIEIDRTFTDYTFPNSSDGYLPAVTFTQGHEHMNGTRALIFARSRHAAGPEGTDFARSVRQQKIITAAKSKVVDLNLITDAGKINELADIVGDHFHTNLAPGELIHLYDIGKDFGKDQVTSLSLDPETNLICPQILESNGAYVLTVCPNKTPEDIIKFFKNSFDTGALTTEHAVVWLADSSVTGKLYKRAELVLDGAGLTTYKVIYTGKPLTQSVVYAVNNKPATIEYIKNELHASPVSLPPPGIKIDKSKVDVIIILGSEDSSSNTNN